MSALLRKVNTGLLAEVDLEARTPRRLDGGTASLPVLCTPTVAAVTVGVANHTGGDPIPADTSAAPADDPANNVVTY